MFKKYFLSILSIFVFSFVFVNHSHANLINVTGSTGQCATSQNILAEAVSDFKQDGSQIVFCASGQANTSLSIKDFINDNIIYGNVNLDNNGQGELHYSTYSPIKDWGSVSGGTIKVKACDSSSCSLSASYYMNISYATITLTNDQNLSAKGTITSDKALAFTCTKASEMYYDGVLQASDYDGSKNYTLIYSPTPTAGFHIVECDNIGGSQTRKTFNFNIEAVVNCPSGQVAVAGETCHTPCSTGTIWDEASKSCKVSCPTGQVAVAGETCHTPCSTGTLWDEASKSCKVSCPTNQYVMNDSCVTSCPGGYTADADRVCQSVSTFNITNVSSTPNISSQRLDFTWNSDADICNLYNYDKSIKQASGSGANGSWSASIASAPGGTGPYGYYVKCYASGKIPATGLETDADPNTGWLKYNVTLSCPSGYEVDISSGVCITSNTNQVAVNVADQTAEVGGDATINWSSDGNSCQVNYSDGNGTKKEAHNWAKKIMTMPVKVPSAKIQYIKAEATKYNYDHDQ
jgi:hypothetical protein